MIYIYIYIGKDNEKAKYLARSGREKKDACISLKSTKHYMLALVKLKNFVHKLIIVVSKRRRVTCHLDVFDKYTLRFYFHVESIYV